MVKTVNYNLEMDYNGNGWSVFGWNRRIQVYSNKGDERSFSFDEFHYNLIEV